jgi:type II restriction enzyme
LPTEKQALGEKGERLVAKLCHCPRCKRAATLRRLRTNFKCADIICDFCGYLAQVKTMSQYTEILPDTVLGAAWSVQKERIDAGVYIPLFLVQVEERRKRIAYLAADLQDKSMFSKRKPLSTEAKRAGWQGFLYTFSEEQKKRFVILVDIVSTKKR